MKSRQEIKTLAKAAMREQRGTAISLLFFFGLLAIVSSAIDFAVLYVTENMIAYYAVFWLGMAILYVMFVNVLGEYIKIYKHEKASAGALFSGLSVNFLRKLGGTLWMSLWIFLWTLLLIIPGIIKSFSYSMTMNILADCPNVTARKALKLSMRITKGHKLSILAFGLSYIGWLLLSALTFYILYIVYVGPYYWTAWSGLYLEMREEALRDGRITLEDLGMSGSSGFGNQN